MPRLEVVIAIAALTAGIAIGLGFGYLLWGRQVVTVAEGVAMPINHDDGSVTAIRLPEAKPRLPAPTTPKGKTTRIIEVEVKPEPVNLPARTVDGVSRPPERVECQTVSVRLDTTRIADGTHRVSVVAQGGEILDAVDIPVEKTTVVIERKWALGYERTPEGANGIALERDIGALRVGATMAVQDHPSFGFRLLWKF